MDLQQLNPGSMSMASGSSEDGVTADATEWQRRVGRQRERRVGIDELLRKLDDLVTDSRPTVASRSQVFRSGRTRTGLLEAATAQIRRLMELGTLQPAVEQAYTTQSGAGLIAIELKSGRLAHQSLSFEHLSSWIPAEARGNIRVCLESRDGDDFHSFCQSVVRDAGEPYGETFLGRDKVVGRSVTVRFFTRAPGPPGLRNPEWLLMVRAVKLTLAGVQTLRQGKIPAAVGVFTADLSGGAPPQWTLQVAHVRYLLDLELASGSYDMDTTNVSPLAHIEAMYPPSKREGASVFGRAATQLEYTANSALSMAQRAASWMTRAALQLTHTWRICLTDDDAVSISCRVICKLVGGLSHSLSIDLVGGKAGFSLEGLEYMFFVVDPEQPLDRILRAVLVRITAAKTPGEFDVHHPFVISCIWPSNETFFISCKSLSLDSWGNKLPSMEDVSQLFEELRVSPGAGLFSDGGTTICVGQPDVQSMSTSPHSG